MLKHLGHLSLTKAQKNGANTALITGIISTEDNDLQGESIDQNGLDFSYFMRKGWLNYDHQQGPSNILGYPLEVTREGPRTMLKGVLMLDQPRAREIYDTAQTLKSAGGARSLGFSVEGQVIERDKSNPQRITRARVLHVAITPSPVNPHTSLELIKSLIGYQTPSEAQELSALVPQQLGPTVNASSALLDDHLSSIISALGAHFPSAPSDTILKTALELMGAGVTPQ